MKPVILGTFVTLAAAAQGGAQAPPAELERLRAQLSEAEEILHQFQRLIPPEFDAAGERQWIDRLAEKAGLASVGTKVLPGSERLMTMDREPVPIEIRRVEIAGRDDYPSIHFFLSMLRLRSRLIGLESLELTAGAADEVRFVARLAYPFWSEVAEPDAVRADVLTAARQRVARARAIRDAVAAAVGRARDDGPAVALAALTNALEDHAVALASARIAGGLSIEGHFLGSAGWDAIERALRSAKLQVTKLERARTGLCGFFSIAARPEARSDDEAIFDAEFTPGGNIFDGESAAFCGAATQSPPQKITAGAVAGDAFFLRLRDVAIRDVFLILNELLGENFVVDQDVSGRVDVDVSETATLDDLLAALTKGGLTIGEGPLRRVARTKKIAAGEGASGGEPVTLSFRDADLAGVLCLFSRLSGREILVPPDTQQRVTIFATDLPLNVAMAALAPKAGAGAVNACEIEGKRGSRLDTFAKQPHDVPDGDLRLAGIARLKDGPKAWAYAPGGLLMPLAPDSQIPLRLEP